MGKYYNESNSELENVTDRSYAEVGEDMTGGMPLEENLSRIANTEAGTEIAIAEGLADIANLEAGTDITYNGNIEHVAHGDNFEAGEDMTHGEGFEAGEDMTHGEGFEAGEDVTHGEGFEAGEDMTHGEGVTENAPYHNIAKYKMVTPEFGVNSEGVDTQKS